MTVKITVDKISGAEKYPYIGVNKEGDRIVLFTGRDAGFVLKSSTDKLGYFSGTEDSFTRLNGKVTMENE